MNPVMASWCAFAPPIALAPPVRNDCLRRLHARLVEVVGRLLATRAGAIELKTPRPRSGSFFPSLLEPRRRIDQALYAVIAQAYVEGISTRSVDDLVQARGIASGISRTQVSGASYFWSARRKSSHPSMTMTMAQASMITRAIPTLWTVSPRLAMPLTRSVLACP
jgi:hypothetical protein